MTTFSQFIDRNLGVIVEEFAAFARTTGPAAAQLGLQELRDHARIMLEAVAADMGSAQSDAAQHRKAIGAAQHAMPSPLKTTAQRHAQHRFEQGFSLPEMLSEYRALRASVIRRWMLELDLIGAPQLAELVRFGEAVDEGLTEAIAWYSGRLEASRNLLIGVLAHDLRSPLGAVQASADYLLHRDSLRDDDLRAVTRIAASTHRMASYVDDLLDFTQTLLGAGLSLSPARVDLVALCEEVVAELRAAHPTATVQFEALDRPAGHWDAKRLAQLISNLGANAIHHGAPLEPVRVAVSQADGTACVAVHNEGPPIAAENLAGLFRPSMKARTSSSLPHGSSGLGLGLYIAREIAVAHGGSITVESDVGSGTTFTVRLPVS